MLEIGNFGAARTTRRPAIDVCTRCGISLHVLQCYLSSLVVAWVSCGGGGAEEKAVEGKAVQTMGTEKGQ